MSWGSCSVTSTRPRSGRPLRPNLRSRLGLPKRRHAAQNGQAVSQRGVRRFESYLPGRTARLLPGSRLPGAAPLDRAPGPARGLPGRGLLPPGGCAFRCGPAPAARLLRAGLGTGPPRAGTGPRRLPPTGQRSHPGGARSTGRRPQERPRRFLRCLSCTGHSPLRPALLLLEHPSTSPLPSCIYVCPTVSRLTLRRPPVRCGQSLSTSKTLGPRANRVTHSP
jgi:hypothetical protein